MKKLLSTLILALVCLSSAWAQQDPIRVSNLSEFREAMKDPNAHIVLTEDIDFGGNYYTFFDIHNKFHGTINGNDHTIKNIKFDNTGKNEKPNQHNALISFAEGATFKNLTLDNVKVKFKDLVGALVGGSKNCTYEKINLTNSEISIHVNLGSVGGLVCESDHDSFTFCKTDNHTSVISRGYAGGLVYKANVSVFTDCWNNAEVSGVYGRVGGIVGSDKYSTFTRCINSGYVRHNSGVFKDDDELGGIVATATGSDFFECVNDGKLYCEDEYGGGIVGFGKNVTLINCLNTSQELEFSENTCGGIIGSGENSRVASCLSLADYPLIGEEKSMRAASGNNYRLEVNNHKTSDWVMGVSDKLLTSGIVTRWLNNCDENRWKIMPVWHQLLFLNKYYPYLRNQYFSFEHVVEIENIEECMHISSADQLMEFAKKVNSGDQFACAVLDADINLHDYDWKPIGTDQSRFRGCFDGKGHTIKGIWLEMKSDTDAAGIFGVAHTGAEIRNLKVKDCTFVNNGEGGAAGILGRVNIGWAWANVVIENCGTSAGVAANKHAGGILGRVTTGDKDRNVKIYINKCFNTGTIVASNSMSGLLCGYTKNNAYITNCWSTGFIDVKGDNCPAPYDKKNPSGEIEFFAGYDQKIYFQNCYAIDPYKIEEKDNQNGVVKMTSEDLANGKLTYYLNRFATEGDLDWYQKIGVDEYPIFSSRGGDVVYAYSSYGNEAYTNDKDQSGFLQFGPIRVSNDYSMAWLDGNSTSDLTLKEGFTVEKASLNRSFKAHVPSTLVLPFSGRFEFSKNARFFTFSAMTYDKESNKYTAVMDQTENEFKAYTPYLVFFSDDTEALEFDRVNIEPVAPAVTQQKDWYFIGTTGYKVLGLDDEESQYYYGYAGIEFDGFKLGEFSRLGEGASIAPFRCYMRHIDSAGAPDSFDVVTRKAPTRSAVPGNQLSVVTEEIPMPKTFDVILKAANGETGIATFDNETGEFRFDGWYDLNGNRVEENYQGVRVGGGKKIIKK